MKKLMLLGGSRYLLPVIKKAHELGIHVITCDYLPDNYAHKFSDEYHNVSIVDKEAVLELAKKLQIDGIMSFATDPGVVTAAYVAEKMDLPGNNPYESVAILQNKGRFRRFLKDHGFNVPKQLTMKDMDSIDSVEKNLSYPVIVKPTDSAGSKGVTRVDNRDGLGQAVRYAFQNSLYGEIIIEEFIEKDGFSTDTDSFSIDGKLVFFSLNDQWFDDGAENIYTPAAYSWPSTMPMAYQTELKEEVQRLLHLLNMGTSLYNIETRVGKDGKAYIMEVSPRGGGNRLSEMLHYACGQDLIRAAVQGALGLPIDQHFTQPAYRDYWGIIILHSKKEGCFDNVVVDMDYQKYVIENDIWVKRGSRVHSFTGANMTIGTMVLKCDQYEKLYEMLFKQNLWLKLQLIN